MGELISTAVDLDIEVIDSASQERVPGVGWTLPEETAETIRAIDANIRAAEQMSGTIFVG